MILPVVLEAESIRAQVERILQGKHLRFSEGQRRLLSYLVDKSLAGEADDLKEYAIGVDAFGKPASYDPRQESVVRMQVARLRQKLTDYYRTEGSEDPILVDLPKGGFKVTFEARPIPPVPVEPEVRAWRWRLRESVLAASLALALAGILYVSTRPVRAEHTAPEAAVWTAELQQLWTPILNSNRPLVVCIATPSAGSSAAGTASGAFLLGQFLAPRKQHVLLTRGDLLSMPEIMMDNVVFIGPSTGNRQLEAVPVDQQIELEPDGIRNLHPRSGEPAFLADRVSHNPQDVEESHALISHIPGLYGNGEILSLSGNHISSVMAAVQALTDPALARTLVARMKAADGSVPRYFQVVLKVKSMDDMPVAISYVFHRELSAAHTTNVAKR
ncbi:MAG TPA: hypothetical protein VKT49_15035 [Bryobacteraceae bacterium]|nr:hypothetical protein [Bryobacteraceae bacterium]